MQTNWWSSCALCSQIFVKKEHLCRSCWQWLWNYVGPNLLQSDYDFRVYSLFSWSEYSPTAFSRFFYSLKYNPKPFLQLAEWFLKMHTLDLGRPDVLVPVPPSQKNSQDHAFFLARNLGEFLGVPIVSCLDRLSSGDQKKRSRKERQAVQLVRNSYGGESLDLSKKRVVLVDDVITTGATAKAAFEALGRPESFEVWAVGCRRRKTLI